MAFSEKEREWLSRFSNKGVTTAFIREILGCTCPPAVFEHFQVQHLTSEPVPMVQLIMGDRLLVRMADAEGLPDPEKTVPRLLEAGVRERDRRGLNRYRLVLVGRPPSGLEQRIAGMESPFDEKVHVHILPTWEKATG
jgi:hypothetical protein